MLGMLAGITSARKLSEVGLGLALLGALVIAWGAWTVLRRPAPNGENRRRERMYTAIGGLLMAAGFVVQIFGVRAR